LILIIIRLAHAIILMFSILKKKFANVLMLTHLYQIEKFVFLAVLLEMVVELLLLLMINNIVDANLHISIMLKIIYVFVDQIPLLLMIFASIALLWLVEIVLEGSILQFQMLVNAKEALSLTLLIKHVNALTLTLTYPNILVVFLVLDLPIAMVCHRQENWNVNAVKLILIMLN
jgi:hypothetical protein